MEVEQHMGPPKLIHPNMERFHEGKVLMLKARIMHLAHIVVR